MNVRYRVELSQAERGELIASRPPKPGEFCVASSSTTPPSMPVGSTWSRSRSACSVASAWTAESTTQTGSAAKSTHGNDNETPPAPASIGCSQPKKLAPKWAAPIPSRPKSHNHCAGVLGRSSSFPRAGTRDTSDCALHNDLAQPSFVAKCGNSVH